MWGVDAMTCRKGKSLSLHTTPSDGSVIPTKSHIQNSKQFVGIKSNTWAGPHALHQSMFCHSVVSVLFFLEGLPCGENIQHFPVPLAGESKTKNLFFFFAELVKFDSLLVQLTLHEISLQKRDIAYYAVV